MDLLIKEAIKQYDSALLLHSTPKGRGINLKNWYSYQQHMAIHHVNPDTGDRRDH
jgi:hypothetical protein